MAAGYAARVMRGESPASIPFARVSSTQADRQPGRRARRRADDAARAWWRKPTK